MELEICFLEIKYFIGRLAICFLWLQEERILMSIFCLKSAWNFHVVLLYNVQFCAFKLHILCLVYDDKSQTITSLWLAHPISEMAFWKVMYFLMPRFGFSKAYFLLLHSLWKNLSSYAQVCISGSLDLKSFLYTKFSLSSPWNKIPEAMFMPGSSPGLWSVREPG